jgi:hypothetical protein
MKKAFIVILSLIASFFVTAQVASKQQEVGLVFSNLDNFGLTYKTGTNQSMWRFNALVISSQNSLQKQDSFEVKNNANGINVKMGKEFCKKIDENFEFRYGADLSFTYQQEKSEGIDNTVSDINHSWLDEQKLYQPGFNLVFGFNYIVKDKLIIGAELMPYFNYSFGKTTNKIGHSNEFVSNISGFNYGLSNSSAMLSVSYRF